MTSKLRGPGFLRRRLLLVAGVESADEGGSSRRCHLLQPGEDSPHVRRRSDFILRIPCLFRPGCSVTRRSGNWIPTGGRSLCWVISGWWFRKDMSTQEASGSPNRSCSGGGGSCFQHHTFRRRRQWCARDFPFPEVVSRSGVRRRTGVRDLSGVRDRSGVLRTGD